MQKGDVKESFADIDYSNQQLGFKPETNLELGVSKFINTLISYIYI